MTRHHTTNVPFPIISFCCSLDTRTHTHNGFYLASDQKYHNPLFVKNRLPFLNIWFFIGMQACFLTQSNAFNTKHTHTHTFTLPSQLLAPELLTTYMFTTQHVPWPHNMCSPHNMHMCSPHNMHMCRDHTTCTCVHHTACTCVHHTTTCALTTSPYFFFDKWIKTEQQVSAPSALELSPMRTAQQCKPLDLQSAVMTSSLLGYLQREKECRLAECHDDLLTLRVPTTWEKM